jgi:hypothetical protein
MNNTHTIPGRSGHIHTDIFGKLQVVLYENDQVHRVVDVGDHNIHYAEDVVENWCTGVIES